MAVKKSTTNYKPSPERIRQRREADAAAIREEIKQQERKKKAKKK